MKYFLTWIILSFTLVQSSGTNLTISGKIRTNVDFYFQKFPVLPSKLATIEYFITFNRTHTGIQCVEYNRCKISLDIYTTENDRNLEENCSMKVFGQLFNEDLHTPMRPRTKPYRLTTCKLDEVDPDMLHCEGRAMIQDYIPRKYGFSFGYSCEKLVTPSLRGLSFNFTISGQSNKTTCIKIPEVNDGFFMCHNFYSYTSLPNMVGLDEDRIKQLIEENKVILTFGTTLGLILSPDGKPCHEHVREIMCQAYLPRCEIDNEEVIQPCKETCDEFFKACSENIMMGFNNVHYLGSDFSRGWRIDKLSDVKDKLSNCSYLPSVNGLIPCFYKPVTCESPSDITNARIINGSNETYIAMSQVEYECLNETFQMEGNETVTCLYNGQWTEMPSCLERKDLKRPNLNPFHIVVPLLMMSLLTFVIAHIVRKFVCQRRKAHEQFTRMKEYDAFVCYEYNQNDQDFAENTIRIELEEKYNPSFKLCIHRRDFKAAWDIMWNIRNAIQNSNSTIIVMSQDYVDSLWCKEEFEQCYIEHMKDPAFKLFVIMMQPIEQLNGTSEYMKSFFDNKTYLERDDPKLYQKIGEYLLWVKKAKVQRKEQPEEETEEQEMEELI